MTSMKITTADAAFAHELVQRKALFGLRIVHAPRMMSAQEIEAAVTATLNLKQALTKPEANYE